MQNLIIIGAGGMGREVYNLATQSLGYGIEFIVKGFLDFDYPYWDISNYPPIIGIEDSYIIDEKDVFTCSIGDVKLKKKVIEKVIKKGGKFVSLIHQTALINRTAKLGEGCLVFHYAQVGSEAIVGNHVLLQSYSGVAHDVTIGDYSRIDVQVLCVGGVKVGKCVTIHSAAILNRKVVVEDGATIGATSFVIKRVKKGVTVFGNPAREL